MPKSLLNLNASAPAAKADVIHESLITFHDRDGGGAATFRVGQVAAFRSDVQPSARVNAGLGVVVSTMTGHEVRLPGVSAETVQSALEDFYGDREPMFRAVRESEFVRVHHVTALDQGGSIYLAGGHRIAGVHPSVLAELAAAITPLPAIEHHEPTELRQSTAAWNADTEPQPFDPAKTYAQYAVVRFDGVRYSRLVARGLTGVPDVDSHLWRLLA